MLRASLSADLNIVGEELLLLVLRPDELLVGLWGRVVEEAIDGMAKGPTELRHLHHPDCRHSLTLIYTANVAASADADHTSVA